MSANPHLPYLPNGGSAAAQGEKPGLLRRIWRGFWRFVEGSRRWVLNLVWIAILGAVLAAIFSPNGVKVADKSVLVLNLAGPLVEQGMGAGARDQALALAQGDAPSMTRLRDLAAVLDAAAKDARIGSALLMLDSFEGGGLSSLREATAALSRFKASGKKVVAWGSAYDQKTYYLAAHADEVLMHPMGMVMLTGYGRTRNYYKDLLDRVGVSANVVRVGTFKNAAEPYFANAPSPASLESEKFLWDDLWARYTGAVETARKLPKGAIAAGIEDAPAKLEAAKGDLAQMALQGKLVDGLKTRDELRTMMIERGAKDAEHKSFAQINFAAYLATLKPQAPVGDAVGIVVAEGEISDGSAPAGRIGGYSTAELVRKAREDESIKAIVLRVNSPGGSAFGSELIRRELELTKKAGKPIVVSMGNLAASGGYWISMASDEIMADEATITGSIGVFGMMPSAAALIDKTSVRTGGYHTAWLGNAGDPRLATDPKFLGLIQLTINRIYADFTQLAATARKTTPEKIDAVAQGRVWTGAQAKERGLVDTLGGLDAAVKSAASKAKITVAEGKTAPTRYIEAEKGRFEQLVENFSSRVVAQVGARFGEAAATAFAQQLGLGSGQPGAAAGVLGQKDAAAIAAELGWLAQYQSKAAQGMPFSAVVHCMCTP